VKERVITAICLLIVVLPIIYFGGYLFLGLGLVAVAIAIFEMFAMHDKEKTVPIWIKLLTFAGILYVVFFPTFFESNLYDADIVGCIIALILLSINRKRMNSNELNIRLYPIMIFYLGLSFRALLQIRTNSLALFIFLVVTVILTDSGAYFAGRFFGKRKLAPKLSPKKTVEGAIGGFLIGLIFALLFGINQQLFAQTWTLILLSISIPILSQLGDLTASAFKRGYGIKDYGKIFPGHGGVMDRVDSQLLAAVLIYLIMLSGGIS